MSSGRKTIDELFTHISNGDDTEKEYLYNWVAHAFKEPRRKSHHLILQGTQGTGKTIFTNVFLRLAFKMKHHCFLTLDTNDPVRDCWGKFNGKLEGVGLVILNELSNSEYKKYKRHIVGMLLDSHLVINHRHGSMDYLPNCLRVVSTTNEMDLDFDLENEEWCYKVATINERMPEELAKKVMDLTVVDYANFYQEMMEREAHEMVV